MSANFAALLYLVSGALFSDIDGDGDADLVLALEWGSVMVFTNDKGSFTDATERLGLSKYKGLWNGVTIGDLDEDGPLLPLGRPVVPWTPSTAGGPSCQ